MSVPPRTSASAVQGILGGTADNTNWDGITDVTQYITIASNLIDQIVSFAANKPTVSGGVTLDSTTQEVIERYMAAHFYCVQDPLYTSKSTSNASGSFQRGPSVDSPFETTEYGRQACGLDYSGMLRAVSRRQFAGGYWAGLNLSGSTKPDLADTDQLGAGGNTNSTGNYGTLP